MNGKAYNLKQAQHYLTLLDESAEEFVFRTFDDNKERKDRSLARIFIGTIEQHYDALVALNKKGAGVFVNVQETDLKGGRRENVTGIRCIYHELDHEAIRKDPIEPSFIVQSSKGKVHKYWLCEGVKKDYDFAGIIRRCVQDYGSDENAQDISRVLRVAGFYHMKNAKKPQLVSVIHESGGLPYSREQILRAFPPLDVIKKENNEGKNNKNNKKIISVNQTIIDDLQNALLFINSDSREVWIGVGHALKELGEVGLGLWIGWSAKSAIFDHKDALEKWEGFHTNNTGYQAVFKRAYASGWRSKVPDEQPKQEAQEWNDNLSGEIDYIIPFDCVARDIQQWILDSSIYEQPALAFIATLNILGVVIGRNISLDGIKGNLMSIGVANSGTGKDHPLKSVSRALRGVDMEDRVVGRMASGAALYDSLDDSPSIGLVIDEIGHFLASISSKGNGNQYSKEISTILTEAYTSANDCIISKRTKGDDAKIIKEPNINLLGATTERQIFNNLSSDDLADGSLARYFFVFGDKKPKAKRSKKSKTLPDSIVFALRDLVKKYKSNSVLSVSNELDVSEEYNNEKWRMQVEMDAFRFSLSADKEHLSPFYGRFVVMAVQMSMLIDQSESVDVLKWCFNVVKKSGEVFIKKFEHNISDNENERQVKLIESKIKQAGKKGISKRELTQKTRQVSTLTRKLLITELLENGTIFEELKIVMSSAKATTFYFWGK